MDADIQYQTELMNDKNKIGNQIIVGERPTNKIVGVLVSVKEMRKVRCSTSAASTIW